MNNDIAVVSDSLRDSAGSVTWWALSGSVNYDHLRNAWLAAGYLEEDLPNLPSDQVALRRALRQFEGHHRLIRSLPDGSYAVIDEKFTEVNGRSDVEFCTRFRAWVDSGCAVVDVAGEVEDAVDILFERAKLTFEANDLSGWFCDRVAKAQAVPLRDRGGIYFVPEHTAKSWSKFADLVKSVSASRIYEIPAMKSARAVEAVLDATVREAQSEADALTHALTEGNLGVRALKNRQLRCDDMAAKVSSYERLLGVKLDDIKTVFEELQGRAAMAILTIEAEQG